MPGIWVLELSKGVMLISKKFLVDTNILFYIVDKNESKKHEAAKKWFCSMLGKKDYYISLQNLREFASVAIQKSSYTAIEIKEQMDTFSKSFPVINDTTDDCFEAVELSRSLGIKYWDSLLIATMKRNGIKKIITEDSKDFGKYANIKCINVIA